MLVVDEDGKPTISFPNYNSTEQVLLGNRRINADDPQSAVFMNDQFNNRFIVLFLRRQSSRSPGPQANNSRQANAAEDMQLLSRVVQMGLVGAQKADETWRALVQIETSRGSLILKIPTFERSVRKLVEACS